MQAPQSAPPRRRGKEWRERIVAALLLLPCTPVLATCALAIKIEGLFDKDGRGPVFFTEDRVGRGTVFKLLKLRTLTASALASLGPGPTHIALLERQGHVTRVGRVIRQWYLDELPQLINIVRGDMFLIGTRPWPVELYEQEMARGVTRKRDMPAGLVGPVQASKGDATKPDLVALDLDYWEAYKTYPALKLLALDLRILARSVRVQLQHKGL